MVKQRKILGLGVVVCRLEMILWIGQVVVGECAVGKGVSRKVLFLFSRKSRLLCLLNCAYLAFRTCPCFLPPLFMVPFLIYIMAHSQQWLLCRQSL